MLALIFESPVATFSGTLLKVRTIDRAQENPFIEFSSSSFNSFSSTADRDSSSEDSWKIWSDRTFLKELSKLRRNCFLFSIWLSGFLIQTKKSSWLQGIMDWEVGGSDLSVSWVIVSETREIWHSFSSILTAWGSPGTDSNWGDSGDSSSAIWIVVAGSKADKLLLSFFSVWMKSLIHLIIGWSLKVWLEMRLGEWFFIGINHARNLVSDQTSAVFSLGTRSSSLMVFKSPALIESRVLKYLDMLGLWLDHAVLANSNAWLIVLVGARYRKPRSPTLFLGQIDSFTADE